MQCSSQGMFGINKLFEFGAIFNLQYSKKRIFSAFETLFSKSPNKNYKTVKVKYPTTSNFSQGVLKL